MMTSRRKPASRATTVAIIAMIGGLAITVSMAVPPVSAKGYLKLSGGIQGTAAKSESQWLEPHSFQWGVGRGVGMPDSSGEESGKVKMAPGGSSAFGVEREMKESGEKSGSEGDPDRPMVVGRVPNRTSPSITMSPPAEKASPKLMEYSGKGKATPSPGASGNLSVILPAGNCARGARYSTAELGTGERVYRLTDVVITSCTPVSGDSSDRPMENLSLNYSRIEY